MENFIYDEEVNGREELIVLNAKARTYNTKNKLASAKSITERIQDSDAKYVLITPKLVYLSKHAGTSIAAQLADELSQVEEALTTLLMFPLDTMIYTAVIEDSEIKQEDIVSPQDAIQLIENPPTSIYLCNGGHALKDLREIAGLKGIEIHESSLKFGSDAKKYQLTSPAFAFAKAGLIHSTHLIVLGALVIASVLAYLGLGLMERMEEEQARKDLEASMANVVHKVDSNLKSSFLLAYWLLDQNIDDGLSNYGLTKISFGNAEIRAEGEYKISSYGEAESYLPLSEYVQSNNGSLSLDSSSTGAIAWVAQYPTPYEYQLSEIEPSIGDKEIDHLIKASRNAQTLISVTNKFSSTVGMKYTLKGVMKPVNKTNIKSIIEQLSNRAILFEGMGVIEYKDGIALSLTFDFTLDTKR